MDSRTLLSELKSRLQATYGTRLQGVVLYGSEARGTAGPDSDIDVLVLLDGPLDYGIEARTIIKALYDLVLALERPIDAKPVDVAAYDAARYPLYRFARAEGLTA